MAMYSDVPGRKDQASRPQRGQGQRVLIVEDNSTNARLTADMLRSFGYVAHIAQDGSQGLQMARELQPDLILTDLQMPGMNGLLLPPSLRANRRTASIPVIAVTAHALDQ